jgi:hypothetical protein
MNPRESSLGKIAIGGTGIGGVTDNEIRDRAMELASINGRANQGVTDDDLRQAQEELLGRNLPASSTDDLESSGSLSRDPSDPPSLTGHQTPDREGPDEEQVMERLVMEGVEEANHEQMLQGRRKRD